MSAADQTRQGGGEDPPLVSSIKRGRTFTQGAAACFKMMCFKCMRVCVGVYLQAREQAPPHTPEVPPVGVKVKNEVIPTPQLTAT